VAVVFHQELGMFLGSFAHRHCHEFKYSRNWSLYSSWLYVWV